MCNNDAMEELRLLNSKDNEYILQNNLLKATNDILFVAGGPTKYYFLIMEIRLNVLTAISNLKIAPQSHNILFFSLRNEFLILAVLSNYSSTYYV